MKKTVVSIDAFYVNRKKHPHVNGEAEPIWRSEAVAFITGFSPCRRGIKKSGDNSDRKMVLRSQCPSGISYYGLYMY